VGPLQGVTVIEVAGLGALPFGAMVLADLGADVIRVDRRSEVPAEPSPRPHSALDRGRRSVAVDLKHPDGVEVVLRLAEHADVLCESFRPGVAERLGIGPDVALDRNPKLVYGRLTGWGQTGPLASSAGHDLNYVSLTGAVRSIGPIGGPPVPPLQILGDFAGGGQLLALGVCAALVESQRTGKGQVVDAAMVDGVMSFLGVYYQMANAGSWSDEIGTNLFDGGCYFFAVYECADGGFVSVACIEPQFHALVMEATGLAGQSDLPGQWDRSRWPEMRDRLAAAFRTKTRAEWCELLEGTDACVAPVLTLTEVQQHPHHVARGRFVPAPGGGTQVAPAPNFSRTVAEPGTSPRWPGADTDAVLGGLGFDGDELARLRAAGAIG
jgi:alpha-methylacyl-CoA racemase